MRISTRGRYAVMAIIDLYQNSKEGKPVTLAAIADRQKVSLAYLEQMFSKLRKANLIKAVRGPGGGYLLAKLPKDINIAQIMNATHENFEQMGCRSSGKVCVKNPKCNAHHLWEVLTNNIESWLSDISLEAVLNGDLSPRAS